MKNISFYFQKMESLKDLSLTSVRKHLMSSSNILNELSKLPNELIKELLEISRINDLKQSMIKCNLHYRLITEEGTNQIKMEYYLNMGLDPCYSQTRMLSNLELTNYKNRINNMFEFYKITDYIQIDIIPSVRHPTSGILLTFDIDNTNMIIFNSIKQAYNVFEYETVDEFIIDDKVLLCNDDFRLNYYYINLTS